MNSNLESKLDSLSAPDYILQNFEASDRIAVLVRSRKAGETIQRITTATNAASQDFQAWLRHKNVSSDVYIGMNTLRPMPKVAPKRTSKQSGICTSTSTATGRQLLKAVETSALVPRPNYVLETSPEKYQVVWKVEGIAQDQAETLQRAMVREFGGDPAATDSTRVLRLPEFVNRKYETEHVVRAQPGATQTYHLEDFRLRTDLHETPAQYRPHEATKRSSLATSANQNGIGHLPNVPLLAETTPKKSFAELQTIEGTKSTRATRATPSRKLKPHCNARSAK